MITLNRKLKKEYTGTSNGITPEPLRRISIRDKLLIKEIQEMNENLPVTCSVHFEDPNVLSEFILTVSPDEGYWQGGKFKFSVFVTEDYNMAVSQKPYLPIICYARCLFILTQNLYCRMFYF